MEEEPVKAAKLKKNPNVETDFLPDRSVTPYLPHLPPSTTLKQELLHVVIVSSVIFHLAPQP